MERSAGTPAAGVRADDLVALGARPGPFATLWVPTPLAVGESDPLPGSLNHLRTRLVDAGAPDEVAGAMVEAALELRHDGPGAVVVADERGVLLAEAVEDEPAAELVRWSALPSLVPVLAHRQSLVPHVVVVADRTGADITGVSPGGDDVERQAGGDDWPLRKVRAGGWSQRRIQQRAENTWDKNAHDVAAQLVAVAEAIEPETILVAGDVRAVQLLRDALPDRWSALVRELSGGRSDDGSEEARERDVRRYVRTAVAEDTVAVLEQFKQAAGRGEQAATDAASTLAALREGRVDVLLVHDDPGDERTALIGPAPTDVGLSAADLPAVEPDRCRTARLVDAAVHAALGTGASVRVVPAATPPEEQLGAILRW